MNFARTVLLIFSGPSAFLQLMENRLWRVILHFILFCVLLALLSCCISSIEINREKRILVSELGGYFGDLKISRKGILPEKHADQPKTFLLGSDRRLDYLTKESIPDLDKMDSWQENLGIIWTECGFFLWKRFPDEKDRFGMMPIPLPFMETSKDLNGMFQFHLLTSSGFRSYLEKEGFLKTGANYPTVKNIILTPEMIGSDIVSGILIYLFLSSFFSLFMLALLTSFFFALFQHLFSGKEGRKLCFSQLFSIMIYASFPALLFGCAFMLLDLSFISYQMAFFIIFFIYQISVNGVLQRTLNPPPPPSPEDDNDFF